MSKSNIKLDVIELFKELEKKEKNIKEAVKSKSDDTKEFIKIEKSISEFIDKKNKNKDNNKLTSDIIDSLKVLKEAYCNISKNKEFNNNFLFPTEKKINNYLIQSNKLKKSEQRESKDEFTDDEDELIKEFEIIASPTLNGIIEECYKLQKKLDDNKIKEESNKINELIVNVSTILIEVNKLKDNKKLIDDEAIKRLNDEINAIKKESEKIYNKKKNTEKYNLYSSK